MNTLEIANGIYYVGVNDRTLGKFEGLWSLPYVVSYNSYIVKGEKTALIDSVEISHCTKILEQIEEILGGKPLDYLVINHIEPDHSQSRHTIPCGRSREPCNPLPLLRTRGVGRRYHYQIILHSSSQ